MSDESGVRQKHGRSERVNPHDSARPHKRARRDIEQVPSIDIIREGESAGPPPALAPPDAPASAVEANEAAPAPAPVPAPAPAPAPTAQAAPPAAPQYTAQAAGASRWGSLVANNVLETLHSMHPQEVALFHRLFGLGAARLEYAAHMEVALMLDELQNPTAEREDECRTHLAEEDAFVYEAVAGLCRLQGTPKATVAMWREQLFAEEQAWREEDPRRQSPLGKARARAEKTYWTSGSSEWYVRARDLRTAGSTSPLAQGSATSPAPAGSSEQAAEATVPSPTLAPAEPNGSRAVPAGVRRQTARWAAKPAECFRQPGDSPALRAKLGSWASWWTTEDRGRKRGASCVEEDEQYETNIAWQQTLSEGAKQEMLQERKKIRRLWTGPEAVVYEQLAVEMRQREASQTDVVEAKVAADDGIREWEKQEFVAACGDRGRATPRTSCVEVLDGGTARNPFGGLSGGATAAAGGGAMGVGLAAGGAQENAGPGEAGDGCPVQVHAPPSGIGVCKRKRRRVEKAAELEEPED